jgi:two-component system, NarL family, nitrate/nitrite response regulator NarL
MDRWIRTMETPLDRESDQRRTQPDPASAPRSMELSAYTPGLPVGGVLAIIASGLRLLRDGLADALARSTTITVAATAADVEHTRAVIVAHQPDVVLLDIEMPGCLALVRAVHDAGPSPKLVAFAASDADDALITYIEAGIDGYVTRDGSLSDVVATVESVGRGEPIVSPRLAASLFQHLAGRRRRDDRDNSSRTPELTSRERQILGLVEQGMANKEIARTLGIELATVKNHVHHVLEKLEVSRRGQAAARARAANGRGS